MAKKDHGTIVRKDDGTIVVTVKGITGVAGTSGVKCIDESTQTFQKTFSKTTAEQIFLPSEYEKAVKTVLKIGGEDIIVIGANGYSNLSDEKCREWGVKPGAYKAACSKILFTTTRLLQEEFPGIDIRFAHGASDLGIDRAIIDVAMKLNRPHLGHSCPRFMFWVKEEDIIKGMPVYVANTQEEYSNQFIESLDILIAANGRIQSFQHDIDAAFKKLKHVIPINVLKSISETGGPPAIGPDGTIEDAVAAFEQRVHMMAVQFGMTTEGAWDQMINHVNSTTINICRKLLSPDRAFGIEKFS